MGNGQRDGQTHDDSIYRASIVSRARGKNDTARIAELDIDMFHDKPRKLETYLFWGQKAKGQGHEAQKNNARVGYFALL